MDHKTVISEEWSHLRRRRLDYTKCKMMKIRLVERKKTLFNRVFGAEYSLTLIDIKVWDNKDGRELAEVSFGFGELMTALDIQAVCKKIAKWLGGELYGTINLDFSCNKPSLEMMVEFA